MGVNVAANAFAPTEYRLDYSAADLAEFDQLIDRYCGVVFSHDTERQQQKREQLLAARRRMAPARVVMIELAQFRALVAEVGS